jgi:peptidoglycan/xylan/chitin deacetylase (PgdA/CDA1 family)
MSTSVHLARLAMAALAPAGARSRLSILIYHRVRARRDPLFPAELESSGFERHLEIAGSLFNVLPLSEAIRRLRNGTLPSRPACITFDDGYADNAEVALPLLKQHRMTCTFFVSTGYLDGGRMWNDTVIESVRGAVGDVLDLTPMGLRPFAIASDADRRATISALLSQFKYLQPAERDEHCAAVREASNAAMPDDLMLSSAQVRMLHAAGMEIGAHTVTHPILARIPIDVARREIADGRDALQTITGTPVTLFAYPNGKPGSDYKGEHVDAVRALGFDAAVTTSWGVATIATDPLQLPRFTPWDGTASRIAMRFIRNLLMPPAAVS